MNGDFKVDVVPLIEYTTDKLKGFFGKDLTSITLKSKLEERIRFYIQDAAFIKSIGMPTPIPIKQLYQPTLVDDFRGKNYSVDALLRLSINKLIIGNPGTGKSILLNWILIKLSKNKEVIPVMFRLRMPNEIEELSEFVEYILNSKIVKKKSKILLLIDGYDEVHSESRKWVIKILNKISSSSHGRYILTSRDYYYTHDIKSEEYRIKPFTPDDSLKFLKTYLEIYGVKENASSVIDELYSRGFDDFLENPLMLTLICVLKTGALRLLPNHTLGLIKRAIDTLTFRWDESKGISRNSPIPLDGTHRIECLKLIAYNFPAPIGKEMIAIESTNKYLKNQQVNDVNPIKFLDEIAQWYGIFIPTSNTEWFFTHRTIHDYLAARYWVETGQYKNDINSITDWNTRAAYAACFIPDATKSIINSLRKSDDEHVLIECLLNNASFDSELIALEILKYVKRTKRYMYYDTPDKSKIRLNLEIDFISKSSNKLLRNLIQVSSEKISKETTVLYVESVFALKERGVITEKEFPIREDLVQKTFLLHDDIIMISDYI